MTPFLKMLLLVVAVDDDFSKWMIFREWLNDDPILEDRFNMACRMGDMIG